jgi:hypothetical protein
MTTATQDFFATSMMGGQRTRTTTDIFKFRVRTLFVSVKSGKKVSKTFLNFRKEDLDCETIAVVSSVVAPEEALYEDHEPSCNDGTIQSRSDIRVT